MSTHIAHESATTCISEGFARVFTRGPHLQAAQLVRDTDLARKGAFQFFCAADICAGIAHSHGPGRDIVDIRLAIHIGIVIQQKIGTFTKSAVRHDNLGCGIGVQDNRIRSHRHSGDIMPLHIALQRAAIGIAQLRNKFHIPGIESAACHVHLCAHAHIALAPHPAHTEN